MTQYLVFENQSTAGLGTQKELVINWQNIKQLKPSIYSLDDKTRIPPNL